MASREARCRRAGVAAHLGTADAQTTIFDGVLISTPVQAFLDLASVGASLVDLVIAGDSLVKANDLDPQQFVTAADAYQGRNARRARRAASLVRAGVDSPMETRLRLLIVLAGLPEPQVNMIVRIASGKWRWRFDLCYPEYKLIIEYDGRQHAYHAEQWSHDLERREWLDQEGWRMLVVISEGIYGDPLRTLHRVKAARRNEELASRSHSSRSGGATSWSAPRLHADVHGSVWRNAAQSAKSGYIRGFMRRNAKRSLSATERTILPMLSPDSRRACGGRLGRGRRSVVAA